MRTLLLFLTALGLALTLCSWIELDRIHQYRVVVKQVQTKAVEKDQHRLRDLRRFNVTVTEFPSMQAVLSELDGVSGLERGWWVVSGIGGAIFVAGLVGLVQSERLRRKAAANNSLQATAAAPSSSHFDRPGSVVPDGG